MSGVKIDYPNISNQKSNEDNMRAVKAYLNELSDLLNYRLDAIEERISTIESALENEEV